jgi:hypothetical protein
MVSLLRMQSKDNTDKDDGSSPQDCRCSRCLLKSGQDPFLDGPFMDQFQQDELPLANQGGEGSVLNATAPAFAPISALNSTQQSDSGAAYSSGNIAFFLGTEKKRKLLLRFTMAPLTHLSFSRCLKLWGKG